ncbi:unnamed protein product, partial [Gulo gulo]
MDVPPRSGGGHIPHVLPHLDAGVRNVSVDVPP